MIEVFGSWCPNCHDAGTWLAALRERVGPERLALLGIAFEYTAERGRSREQLRRYLERHGLERAYDRLLLGGIADKRRASEALPFLSALKAFPTLVLVDRAGRVRSAYTGFAGPATGAAHERETAELELRILALVEEPARDLEPDPPDAAPLVGDLWREEPSQRLWSFEPGGPFEVREAYRFGAPTPEEPVATGTWWLVGDTLVASGEHLGFDRRAGVLLDPKDAGRRLRPAARPPVAVVDGVALDAAEDVLAALSGRDPIARREALYYLALERLLAAQVPPEHRPPPGPRDALPLDLPRFLTDPDALVRATAAWAAGALGDASARDALRATLADGWAPARREAARALGRLGLEQADRAALEALADDVDPEARRAAREALAAEER